MKPVGSAIEKCDRVGAGDARLHGGGEPGAGERGDRIVEAHVERVVTADDHAIFAELEGGSDAVVAEFARTLREGMIAARAEQAVGADQAAEGEPPGEAGGVK